MGQQIYKIAKELGYSNKQIVNKANELGYKVSNHMSSLSDDQINTINKALMQDNTPRLATASQMETINDFVKTYSADLSKSLRQLDLITQISSSKGKYNPLLSEQYLNEMNYNPSKANSNEIAKWLMSPQYFDENIRHLSQYLESAVGQYGRAVWFLNNEKSFKYILTPANGDNKDIVNQQDYINSYYTVLNTLSKMNIKYQFPKMDLQVMQDGVGFYYIKETDDTITFLQLPTDYCHITAPWTYGWLFAIDLTPELTEAYETFVEKRRAGFKGEKLAPFQYFNLPAEKSFCFTFDPGKATKIPPLTGAMGASLDVLSYRDLLKKKSVLDLWKLIAMKIPIDKETKRMQIPYEQAAELIAMIKQQMPENIVIFATPFEAQEVAANQVNTMDKLVDLGDNNVFSALGISAAALGKDNKNAGQLTISTQITFDFSSTHMYTQFANLVNWILMQKTKTYKWKVRFFGNKLKEDKEIDAALRVTTTANMPYEYLMANLGFEPFEMESFINWTDKLDIKSRLKPLQSMNTQSGNAFNEGGRPEKDVGDMQESGEKSREYKGNRIGSE